MAEKEDRGASLVQPGHGWARPRDAGPRLPVEAEEEARSITMCADAMARVRMGTVREIMPSLTEDEARECEERLRRFYSILSGIVHRQAMEGEVAAVDQADENALSSSEESAY